MEQLNNMFETFKVPPFAGGNGSYFCDADINTEEFQLAMNLLEIYPPKIVLFQTDYRTFESSIS